MIFSFVVDAHPKFQYQAFMLAKSIVTHFGAKPKDIYIHFSEMIGDEIISIFRTCGYSILKFTPFGDGKYCNKLVQLEALSKIEYDKVLLLDTDTIILGNFENLLPNDKVAGKIVDLANPSLECLNNVFDHAGITPPKEVVVDATQDNTILGNFNGGLYSIPKSIADDLGIRWKHWAIFLLNNSELLSVEGKSQHIDQVSFSLACAELNLELYTLPSNINYFTHFKAVRNYFDHNYPIYMIHYHEIGMNVLGLLECSFELNESETEALEKANLIISNNFENTLFRNYQHSKNSNSV